MSVENLICCHLSTSKFETLNEIYEMLLCSFRCTNLQKGQIRTNEVTESEFTFITIYRCQGCTLSRSQMFRLRMARSNFFDQIHQNGIGDEYEPSTTRLLIEFRRLSRDCLCQVCAALFGHNFGKPNQ